LSYFELSQAVAHFNLCSSIVMTKSQPRAKLLLAFRALLVGNATGVMADRGYIIYGTKFMRISIFLPSLITKVHSVLEQITTLMSQKSPPHPWSTINRKYGSNVVQHSARLVLDRCVRHNLVGLGINCDFPRDIEGLTGTDGL
jgi:hypothetical protein